MIIGFLGKGGSGKSTFSYRFTKHLLNKNKKVLAIDADYNMDFSYNLGSSELSSYIGNSNKDLLAVMGIGKYARATDSFFENPKEVFSISPKDKYTEKYSKDLSENLSVMSIGPQGDNVLFGAACSHSLGSPLKTYLPYLRLGAGEVVVIDEKAGADGVGTGVTTGWNYAFVVVEPTIHGVKAANQISELLNFFETPHDFVLNKTEKGKSYESVIKNLKKEPVINFDFHQSIVAPEGKIEQEHEEALEKIYQIAEEYKKNFGDNRIEKSAMKFVRNREYKTA